MTEIYTPTAADVNVNIATIYIIALSMSVVLPSLIFGAMLCRAYTMISSIVSIILVVEVCARWSIYIKPNIAIYSIIPTYLIISVRLIIMLATSAKYVHMLYVSSDRVRAGKIINMIVTFSVSVWLAATIAIIPIAIVAPSYMYSTATIGLVFPTVAYTYMSTKQIMRLSNPYDDYQYREQNKADAFIVLALFFFSASCIMTPIAMKLTHHITIGAIISLQLSNLALITDSLL